MKLGILIQARINSTRLPGKILLSVANKSVVRHLYDECLLSGLQTILVVPENDCVKIQDALGDDVILFKGSENDLLERFLGCAKKYGIDVVVRLTSDCPLINHKMIIECLNFFLKNDFEYLTTTNLEVNQHSAVTNYPDGFDIEIFGVNTLEFAYLNAKTAEQREHISPWMRKHTKMCVFNPGKILLPLGDKYSIDTYDDYLKVKNIIENNIQTWQSVGDGHE